LAWNEEAGARRFKKFLNIDMKTVTFCQAEMSSRLQGIKSIKDFLDKQEGKKSRKGEQAWMLHEGNAPT